MNLTLVNNYTNKTTPVFKNVYVPKVIPLSLISEKGIDAKNSGGDILGKILYVILSGELDSTTNGVMHFCIIRYNDNSYNRAYVYWSDVPKDYDPEEMWEPYPEISIEFNVSINNNNFIISGDVAQYIEDSDTEVPTSCSVTELEDYYKITLNDNLYNNCVKNETLYREFTQGIFYTDGEPTPTQPTLGDTFASIADAIRAKTGKSDTMTSLEMPSEIENIPTSSEKEYIDLTIPGDHIVVDETMFFVFESLTNSSGNWTLTAHVFALQDERTYGELQVQYLDENLNVINNGIGYYGGLYQYQTGGINSSTMVNLSQARYLRLYYPDNV